MTPLHVHVVDVPETEALTLLREQLDPSILLTHGERRPDPADYHILVNGNPTAADLDASPNLRALIIPWAGLPEPTRTLLATYPHLTVHNLHHNDAPTAEMAIALLLSAAKRLVPGDQALRAGDWTPRYAREPSRMLAGRTALVLGYGRIGRRVAAVCEALGMRVLAVRRSAPAGGAQDGGVEVWPPNRLPTLLAATDALLITAPLTDETRGMIAAAELAAMPRGGLLVNVARGAIVDEDALFDALATGHLFGAGLDVWYRYPTDPGSRTSTTPSRHPFERLENVVMSPHRGGNTAETGALRMMRLAELLNAAARGEAMGNQVALAAGY